MLRKPVSRLRDKSELMEMMQMKKVIMGSIMMLSGLLSVAIIMAGSMANEWTVDGQFSAIWNIEQYGLMPFVITFTIIAVIGFLIAIWGLVER